MKNLVLATLLLAFWGCNSGGPTNVKLNNDNDKTFYAMGAMMGQSLTRLELSQDELNALYKGINDSAHGKEPEVNLAEYQTKIQSLFKERMDKVAAEQENKGKKFLEEFQKKNTTAKKTTTGLIYMVEKEGTGKAPKEDDTVEVHYHGTLTDGTVFDSSVERGKTATFPLNRVIPGWTEGLQLMKEGGKTKFVIPSELAYGKQGAPPKIPGGATLIFDVELIKVNPEPEAHSADDGHGHDDLKKKIEAATKKAKEAVKKTEAAKKDQK